MKSRSATGFAALIATVCVVVAVTALVVQRQTKAAADPDGQTRIVASKLACPVCQGLSVADSPSQLAVQMRDVVRQKLQTGESEQSILDYFVGAYGESVLLAPPTQGFWLLIWWIPVAVVAIGICIVGFALTRWASRSPTADHGLPDLSDEERRRYAAKLDMPLEEHSALDTSQKSTADSGAST